MTTERSIMYTMERQGALYAVAVRNCSVSIEPLPTGLQEGQPHVMYMTRLTRNISAPSVGGWLKPWEELRSVYLHRTGQCKPCIFLYRKADGCRMGDSCTHCHLCTEREMKQRKNRQLQPIQWDRATRALAWCVCVCVCVCVCLC
ncbi:unnamed protein product [Effrenium voratum]|nr:unnamed protein product [Effrenium voratum]